MRKFSLTKPVTFTIKGFFKQIIGSATGKPYIDKDPFDYYTLRFDYDKGFPMVKFVDIKFGKN